jgi:hypothetical protein
MQKETGAVSGLLISTIVLLVLVLGFGSVMIWALMNYYDQRDNVDQKIAVAVAEAEEIQAEELEAEFIEREKEPTRRFSGPADLGGVTFKYPKTWSVYVDTSRNNTMEAYLHPGSVHGVRPVRPYALRISVENSAYEDALKRYQRAIDNGDLRSVRAKVRDFEGIRLNGKFSDIVEGSMVIFKIRDKTLKVYTEAPNFRGDFNNIILKSLNFNP